MVKLAYEIARVISETPSNAIREYLSDVLVELKEIERFESQVDLALKNDSTQTTDLNIYAIIQQMEKNIINAIAGKETTHTFKESPTFHTSRTTYNPFTSPLGYLFMGAK